MHFQNTIVKQEHLCPQSILIATFSMKHVETYNINVIPQCRFFLFTVSREEDIARESFSFKIILRSP